MTHTPPPITSPSYSVGCFDPEVPSDDGTHCVMPTPAPIPVYIVPKPSTMLCQENATCVSDRSYDKHETCLSAKAPVRKIPGASEEIDWTLNVSDELGNRLGTIRCRNGKLTLVRAK
jgi:hypothetical protein